MISEDIINKINKLAYYKYIHIFWICNTSFAINLSTTLSKTPKILNKNEHLYIALYQQTYDALKNVGISNVFLIPGKPEDTYIANLLAPHCKYEIWHGSCTKIENFLLVERKYLKKIIIRLWGSNRLCLKNIKTIKDLKHIITNFKANNHLKKIAAIGVSSYVDMLEFASHKLNNNSFYKLPYTSSKYYKILAKEKTNINRSSVVNILVGHSGFIDDNHNEILSKLKKYKNENIQIYVPLTYGNNIYIKDLQKIKTKEYNNKITFITQHMPFDKYVNLLHDIDVAIIDGKYSYALDNIAILLYFKKKIFLNKQGVLHKAFYDLKIPHDTTEHLDSLDFYDFSKPIIYTNNNWKELSVHNEEYMISCWKKLFQKFS